MSEFLQKLRMAGIFMPEGGRPPGSTPFGQPNMNSGPDIAGMMANAQNAAMSENALDREHEMNLARMRTPPKLPEIAQQAAKPKPMNVVFNPGITEYQRGTLAGRAADRDARADIAAGRLGLGDRQIQGRADLQGMRGDQVLDQIGARGDRMDSQIQARGDIGSRQIGERADRVDSQITARGVNTDRQIGLRGDIQRDIQNTRGIQGLDAIAARGQNAQDLQNSANSTYNPGETRTAQNLAVRELMSQRPDLAKFITIGTGNSIEISDDATPEERDEINRKVFITRPTGDITLPTNRAPRPTGTTYTNQSVTPKRKYKPSVVE